MLEFDHPSWMIRAGDEKTVKRSAAKAVFTDSATMSHMDLLAGDSLQFDVAWTANEPVSVTVGLQTHNLRRSAGLNFKLYFTGEQVHVQGLRTNQGFVYRHRLREPHGKYPDLAEIESISRLRINGDTALNQPIESGVLRGRGVAFAVKRERPVPGTIRENLITISNLRTGNMRVHSGTVDLQSDKKDQILNDSTQPKEESPHAPHGCLQRRSAERSFDEHWATSTSRFDRGSTI